MDRVTEQRARRNDACAWHGCIFGFPPLAVGLARSPTRTTTRVRCSTQLPGRFASVGTSRFFAPRRSRSSWELYGVVYSFFAIARCKQRCASRRAIVPFLEVRERHAGEGVETCARICPSFVRSHVNVERRKRRGGETHWSWSFSLCRRHRSAIRDDWSELVRANIASSCATRV